MKPIIYYITNVRYPTEKAHGIQISYMCEAFGKVAEEVMLVVPRRRNDPGLRVDPFVFYGTRKTYSIRRLATVDFIGLLPIRRVAFIIQSATYLFFVASYLLFKKRAHALVYTRELEIAALARLFGFRSVLELHSLPRRVGIVYRTSLYAVSSVLAISRGIGRELVKQGYLGRVLSVPDGVKVEMFNIPTTRSKSRTEFGLPEDKKIALYAGHLYAWKGMKTFLEAAVACPDVIFCLAGGTDADNEMMGDGLSREKIPNVRLMGRFPYPRVPGLLRSADVLILPNTATDELASRFTSPLKLFEYMASGVPVVAADVPAIREIANDSMIRFFKADDPQELAGAVRDVLAQPQQAEERARVCQEAVRQYGWDERAERILKEVGYGS